MKGNSTRSSFTSTSTTATGQPETSETGEWVRQSKTNQAPPPYFQIFGKSFSSPPPPPPPPPPETVGVGAGVHPPSYDYPYAYKSAEYEYSSIHSNSAKTEPAPGPGRAGADDTKINISSIFAPSSSGENEYSIPHVPTEIRTITGSPLNFQLYSPYNSKEFQSQSQGGNITKTKGHSSIHEKNNKGSFNFALNDKWKSQRQTGLFRKLIILSALLFLSIVCYILIQESIRSYNEWIERTVQYQNQVNQFNFNKIFSNNEHTIDKESSR